MSELTKCTAIYCPYESQCFRKHNNNQDETTQEYYNYEYECNESTGFSSYISKGVGR